MKIIQQVSIFLLLLISSIQLQANPDCWGSECAELHVMAPSGLSLREKPSLHAKLLLAIPFGKTVRNHGIASAEVMIGGIRNTWRKVTYKGQTGYSFGAYLSSVKQIPSTDINREVRLDFGSGCEGEINYDPRLHWYGIYWDNTNKERNMRSIQPQLLTDENTEEGHFELMDYSLRDPSIKDYPSFMLGSKKKLSPQSSLKDFSPQEWVNLAMVDTRLELGNMVLTASPLGDFDPASAQSTRGAYNSSSPVFAINLQLGSRKQVLSFSFHTNASYKSKEGSQQYMIEPIRLEFAGDLDGDGITDLMIRIGGEKSGENILYLSSYAEEGDILKKVANRGDGYCC